MTEREAQQSAAALLPSRQSLRRLAVSESGFVFDPMSGHHFTVNETGLEILRRLQHGEDVSALLESLGREYSVGARELERDVLEFVGMLRRFISE